MDYENLEQREIELPSEYKNKYSKTTFYYKEIGNVLKEKELVVRNFLRYYSDTESGEEMFDWNIYTFIIKKDEDEKFSLIEIIKDEYYGRRESNINIFRIGRYDTYEDANRKLNTKLILMNL